MKTPTQKQIDAEIKILESYRGKIPPGTLTDNRAALDAQITVLKEKLSHDQIFDRWPDDERDCEIRCNAMDARDWMGGDNDKDKPSKEWKELVSAASELAPGRGSAVVSSPLELIENICRSTKHKDPLADILRQCDLARITNETLIEIAQKIYDHTSMRLNMDEPLPIKYRDLMARIAAEEAIMVIREVLATVKPQNADLRQDA